jgi:transposase
MNKDNECTPFVFEGPVNTDAVIACFDNFAEKVPGKKIVIADNAPVHKSRKFLERLPRWHKQGLNIKFLPPYSPELNLIEILWRKVKYEWLPFSAYTSFSKLRDCVENILLNFGSLYTIEFSKC